MSEKEIEKLKIEFVKMQAMLKPMLDVLYAHTLILGVIGEKLGLGNKTLSEIKAQSKKIQEKREQYTD